MGTPIRTLKEEGLEARQVIGALIERYNREWPIERHSHQAETDIHQQLLSSGA